MSASPQLSKVTPVRPAAERRRKPRRAIADEQIVAVTLDGDNGGLVLDLAEDGVAVQAVAPLQKGKATEMSFALPDGGAAIRAQGEVRWAEASGRAGIRLLAFTQGSSADIRAALQKPVAPPALEEPPQPELIPPLAAEGGDWLEQDIEAQHLQGDAALAQIARNICERHGASGTAIALGTREAMICRASAGAAPGVGARLQSDSGLSGECVRTAALVRSDDTLDDPRVDADVCRTLDLRAAVLLPVLASGKLRGVLEVFSNRPRAFTSEDIEKFEQCAALVARMMQETNGPAEAAALAAQPAIKAAPVVEPVALDAPMFSSAADEQPPRSALMASAPVKYGLAAAAAIALGLAGWGLMHSRRPAAPAIPVSAPAPAPVSAQTPPQIQTAPERSPVASPVKPEPAKPAKEVTEAKPAVTQKAVPAESKPQADEQLAMRALPAPAAAPAQAVAPPVLAPSADSLPQLAASRVEAVRAGQTGSPVVPGRLIHRVDPVYPELAQRSHLGGAVVLNAVIRPDGRVGTVEVVSGNPLLARAAVAAVRQWRYEPFLLNGIPVQAEAVIHLNFRAAGSR